MVSLMCQSVNLFGKIALKDANCVFAYFCGRHKNQLRLQFRSSFKNWYQHDVLHCATLSLQHH